VDERVRGRRADDHVRLLPGHRLEHEHFTIDPRASAHELVALLVAPQTGRERARLEPRQRIRDAL
jgi:hypothetical protein